MCSTGKRPYISKREARRLTRRISQAIRPYHCTICGKWHVANRDKRTVPATVAAVRSKAKGKPARCIIADCGKVARIMCTEHWWAVSARVRMAMLGASAKSPERLLAVCVARLQVAVKDDDRAAMHHNKVHAHRLRGVLRATGHVVPEALQERGREQADCGSITTY